MAFSFRDYAESDEVRRRRQQAEENSVYREAQAVVDARNAMQQKQNNPVSPWTGGTYGDALKSAVDRIQNREKFTYDLNGDALYKQYKDQYINQGRMAMADTMGQAAALTGGYGNSYAASAGNQAYQAYLTKLNDVVPQLYQMALDQYNREGDEMYNQASLLGSMYGTEYGEYRDRVGDYNTELDRLTNMYNTERNFDYNMFNNNRDYYTNAYNNERQWDYGLYSDAYNRGFANYQQSVAESQFAQQMALQQAELAYKYAALNRGSGGSGGGGGSYSGSGSSGASGSSASGTTAAKSAAQAERNAVSNASMDSILAYIEQQIQNRVSDTAISEALKKYGINSAPLMQTSKYNVRVVK